MEQEARSVRLFKEKIITLRLVKPRLDVKYPKVTGLKNSFVQQMINGAILDAVYGLIRTQGYVQDPTKTVTGDYKVELHEKELLSLLYSNYGYAQGAAHGMTYQSSQTFDLLTGQLYTLADLFKPGSNYVGRLSAIIAKEMKARDIPLLTPFKEIRPNQDFYLTPKSIVIYFQLYEYAPYVYGFLTFEIPFAEVQELIDPNGPIGRLM
ncbi:DUF3298 domain-containing protein [Paenibacillus filicis]|uniref:DUF3298 domain-containing protein n=1 Tax=Paenibacillus gyeongsangnamensis TaxID=3388067 RepID=A0ABT4QFR3_9BACL|nr:DUF3298 and DUF4163 domain-containing protein [Paenibacillus filicis]MCZ8515530.1 DUF3298 domain-containing protein [Paenibacillus filicis]